MTEDLLLRVIRGDAEDLETRRVERWRADSVENERHYREVAAIWRATRPGNEVLRGSGPVESTPDETRSAGSDRRRPAAASIAARGEALRRREARARRVKRISGGALPWATAAAVAGIALALRFGGPPGDRSGGVEFVSGPTEPTTVSFPDGSFVRLDAGSRVRFAEEGPRRDAWLTGRAFFGVTADAARPFAVHTGFGEVVVLGTRFEVREDDTGLRVVVVEGRVAVTAPDGSRAEVEKGQVAELASNGDFSVRSVDDVYALLRWDGGLLLFQGTDLAQVAEEVSAHFGVSVSVDARLRARSLTAWFDDDPLEEVVESICLLVEARCAVASDGVRIGM